MEWISVAIAMDAITTGIRQVIIIGRVTTTGFILMNDIYQKCNMINMHTKSGGAEGGITPTGIKIAATDSPHEPL